MIYIYIYKIVFIESKGYIYIYIVFIESKGWHVMMRRDDEWPWCTVYSINFYMFSSLLYIHTNKNHLKTPEATPPNAYSSFAYVLGLFCLCTRSLLPMHLKTPEATPPNAYSCRKRWAPRRATTSAPKNLFFIFLNLLFFGGGGVFILALQFCTLLMSLVFSKVVVVSWTKRCQSNH
jgi:hypothetical protein